MNQTSPQGSEQDLFLFPPESGAVTEMPHAGRFREMFDALPAAIYITDAEGRLMYFNPAAVEFSGRVPELGVDTWCVTWKLYYPDGTLMPHDACPMAIALKEGSVLRGVEAIAERPDGTRIWFELYPTPLRDSTSRIIGGINMLMDITERKQAEAKMRRTEQEFADFFENAMVALHWVAPDGMILRANQAELDLLGYSADEYIGQHIAKFYVDQDVIEDILRRLRVGEELHEYEARMRCKDGSIREVLIDSNVLWENGQFIHTRCFTRDITEHKQAEQARAMLVSIVQSSGDAIISKTLEGVITSWNPAAERMFGYKAEEAIGQSILMIIPPELQHEEQEILARLRRGERVNHFDTVRMARDGRRLAISLDISPMRDASGHIIGASKIARDITDRKQAEAALQQLNETLESRVRSRTKQVRNLVTQLTMSEQEERRRISAILHDDLQQRLFSLNFQLTTLRRGLADHDDMQQVVNEIEEALRDSIQMTRNLSVDLSPPVLYNEGLYAALRWLAAQMERQQQFMVTLVAEESLPPVGNDLRVLLFQFVRELLFNVVKHAGVSAAVVTLAYTDEHLHIEVSDQGKGFDSNIISDENSQGLQRIMQRLQLLEGRLQIDSSPVTGTRITLYVPLRGPQRE